MTGPSYHARTHLHGGTDPLAITGVEIPFAYINTTSGSNISHAGGNGVTVYVPFPSGNFVTNTPSLFTVGTDSFGAGVNTIKIGAGGTYKFFFTVQFFSTAAGSRQTVFYDPPLHESGFQFPNPDRIAVSGAQIDGGFWEFGYGDNATDGYTFPRGGGMWVESHAAGAFTFAAQMYIEWVSSTRYLFG